MRDAREEVAELYAHLEARVEERTRELQLANEELRAFSRSVSHYLRTPMQLIVGYAALLEQVPAEPRTRYAYAIIESTERMAEVLDGLLTYATRGGVPVDFQDVDLAQTVELAWLDQGLAPPVAELDMLALPPVRGDPAALRVAFGNLLHNAVKFTRGRPRPQVQVRADRGPGVVVVEVRDNGVGFDPSDATRLFGAFARLPTVTRFEGLGLGLADVWRIVIAHGGHVRAEGRPGEGATFFVTLPAAVDATGRA
ncbi:sensor histidine kinase [Deinococcus sp. KSM4-11]|nr:sensor histidine kinase [Deinococcus sp. KSM4-11]